MGVFKDYAYYYDLFYKDKNYHREAGLVRNELIKNGVGTGKILSLGCGTGKYEQEFVGFGYCVHGIDMSSEMVGIAKEKSRENEQLSFEVADIREYQPKEKFDAVISLFQVMSYQTSNDDMIETLKTARAGLDVGGIFLFDVWYGPGVLTDFPVVRVKRLKDGNTKVTRIAEPLIDEKKNCVDVHYEVSVNNNVDPVQIFTETHRMRYWFRPELEWFLKMSGFRLIDNYSPDFNETSFDSWTSYFVAVAE